MGRAGLKALSGGLLWGHAVTMAVAGPAHSGRFFEGQAQALLLSDGPAGPAGLTMWPPVLPASTSHPPLPLHWPGKCHDGFPQALLGATEGLRRITMNIMINSSLSEFVLYSDTWLSVVDLCNILILSTPLRGRCCSYPILYLRTWRFERLGDVCYVLEQ